jgi:tetratricopeptide (TPR) repeat protein
LSSEDWYRNHEWNPEIESNFYTKLKRSRSQKSQYIVIQAGILSKKRPEIALRLISEYFALRKDRFDEASALSVKILAYKALSNFDEAILHYKKVLQREREFPNFKTGSYVEYPYFVATQKIKEEYDNAIAVLFEFSDDPRFPLEFYKWHASIALINNDSFHATKALEAAQAKKSGFLFHQNLGLVGKDHASTIKILRKICT